MKIKTYLKYFLLVAVFAYCKPKVDEQILNAGSAVFTRYAALGNSLTAGYADNALYRSAQINSYPNILAAQFKLLGGAVVFNQPLMPDDAGAGINRGYISSRLSLQLKADCKQVTSLSPVSQVVTNPTPYFSSVINAGPYHNLGVPGAKSFHLIAPQYGRPSGGNPFYSRFASAPGSSSVLSDALNLDPTFFTLWIGSNDVLQYATSGGRGGGDSITGINTFTFALNTIVNGLTAKGAKGVIANVPDITNIPYFTTVPYNGLVLNEASQVTQLNTAYKALGITFQQGPNAFIVATPDSPYPRQMRAGEFILLSVPQDSIKCAGWGSSKPIPHTYVLDATEISSIKAATLQYNSVIETIATNKGLALADMFKRLQELSSGLVDSGLALNSQFVSGGAFSLDGIHMNPRGYALVANDFIHSINSKYGSSIPLVDITKFAGITFP